MHCERIVSADGKRHATKLGEAEKVCQVLERRMAMGHVISYGQMSTELTTYSDADWTGDKDTRTSSSAYVVLMGNHMLKAYTRKQKITARSRRSRLVRCSTGSIGLDRNRVDDV